VAKPTGDQIKTNIQAQDAEVWSQADQRPEGLDLFEGDLATAIAGAWSDFESGLIISSVPVTGGSSLPGGPLSEATAMLSPGLLTGTVSFALITAKFSSSFPEGATAELLALVDAVSQGIGQKSPLWVAGYTATLTAMGGSCAWIAPAPPANPTGTPGPWTGGMIQSFALSGGSSAGDQGMTAASLEAAIGNAADPSKLKQNQNALQPALSELIKAIAKGFETTWNQWKSNTKISGGTGSGTASPPSGAVVGAVASPRICYSS
jgi:hypothetical protein